MTEKNRIVIYHGPECADGFTAAWLAWRAFGDTAEYIPAQYGDAPPDVTGKRVHILDFCYPREQLIAMHEKAQTLVLFDHHKDKIKECEGLEYCYFDVTHSGAWLAWNEFEGLKIEDEDVDYILPPKLVQYVEDRDLWKWELHNSREINAYIGTLPKTFHGWDDLHEQVEGLGIHAIVQAGKTVIRQRDQYIRQVSQTAIIRIVNGYDVPVVNASYPFVSELLHDLAVEHDAVFAVGWFQLANGNYKYSLRRNDNWSGHIKGFDLIDLGDLAKIHAETESALHGRVVSGGGHPAAAGFESRFSASELWANVPLMAR